MELVIDVTHSEEFMKEVLHQTKYTPLAKRHPPKESVGPSGKSPLVIARATHRGDLPRCSPLCVSVWRRREGLGVCQKGFLRNIS